MSEICCVVDRCWGASDVCLEAFLEKLSEKRQKASAIYDQTIVNLMRRRKLESSSKSEQRCYYGFVTFWQRSLWEIRVWFQNSIKFLFTFQTNLEKPIELGMTNWVNDKICMKIESYFSFVSGESELLKYSGQDLNRQHLGRPYFRSLGKTYRIRNGYTVTLVCSIENLGKKSYFIPLNQCAFS